MSISHKSVQKVTLNTSKVSKVELSWVGGILDGEGHIRYAENLYGGSTTVRIQVSNTNMGIITEYCHILNKLGVIYNVYTPKKLSRFGNKKIHVVSLGRLAMCLAFAKIILPYIRETNKYATLQDMINGIEFHLAEYVRTDGRKPNVHLVKQNTEQLSLAV